MNVSLAIAAFLALMIGLAHTVLGERFIIKPILRRTDLPRLMNSEAFTRQVLRLGWHLGTVLCWCLAAILFYSSRASKDVTVLEIIAVTFVALGLIDAAMTRAKHFAWPVFIVIGLLTWFYGGFD